MKAPVKVPEVPETLINDPIEAKNVVVVAFVPVALAKVTFWRVVDPLTKRVPALRALENAADAAESVVNAPFTAKKFVVVAFVPVAFWNVKS